MICCEEKLFHETFVVQIDEKRKQVKPIIFFLYHKYLRKEIPDEINRYLQSNESLKINFFHSLNLNSFNIPLKDVYNNTFDFSLKMFHFDKNEYKNYLSKIEKIFSKYAFLDEEKLSKICYKLFFKKSIFYKEILFFENNNLKIYKEEWKRKYQPLYL